MTKYVEWVEPYDEHCDITQILRLSVEDAIKAQKRSANIRNPLFEFDSDERALEDFIVVHWANIVED